jgi:hypothetical protein
VSAGTGDPTCADHVDPHIVADEAHHVVNGVAGFDVAARRVEVDIDRRVGVAIRQ